MTTCNWWFQKTQTCYSAHGHSAVSPGFVKLKTKTPSNYELVISDSARIFNDSSKVGWFTSKKNKGAENGGSQICFAFEVPCKG